MKIQLSKREKNILLHMLTIHDTVTSAELAKQFNISVRTVKYDVDNIRYWLKDQQISLLSKRGKGMWLDLTDSQRLLLKNELLKLDKEEISTSQEKRIHQLIFALLSEEGYITSKKLSHYLEVSQNTVFHSLDRSEQLLAKYNLFLERKSRKGVRILGKELNIRLLMEHLIQKEISEYDIYNIMNRLVQGAVTLEEDNVYIGFNAEFQKIYLKTLEHMAALLSQEQIEKFNYSEILSITIRTTIAVFRMLKSKTLGGYKLLSAKKAIELQRDIPFLLVKVTFESYELPVLESEFEFIYSDVFRDDDSYNIQSITQRLIQRVGEKIDYPFQEDVLLYNNLFAHLSLRLAKKHVYVNEYNPFVMDIKSKHEELFNAIADTAREIIKEDVSIVNDSFISYLALHFLVSIERNQVKETIKVVYVCSTGLGVTSLLQQKIRDEVSDVEVVAFASILNLREEVKKNNPDLIISIFPIENIDLPWVKVNPLPSKEDIKTIREKVAELKHHSSRKTVDFNKFDRRRDYDQQSEEKATKDMLIKGYMVYERLKEELTEVLKEEYLDAFLLHVLLLVHRVEYNQQYLDEESVDKSIIHKNEAVVVKMEQVFSEQDLAVNLSEIIALLQYTRREKKE